MSKSTRLALSVKRLTVGVLWGRSVCLQAARCSGLLSSAVVSVLRLGHPDPEGVDLVDWCTGERPALVVRWVTGEPLAIYRRHLACAGVGRVVCRGPL